MKYEILLIAIGIVTSITVWTVFKLIALSYEIFTEKHYTLKFKLNFLCSLSILLLGLASLGGVAKNVWNSIQSSNAVQHMHEEKIKTEVQKFDAKMEMKFKDENKEWKLTE